MNEDITQSEIDDFFDNDTISIIKSTEIPKLEFSQSFNNKTLEVGLSTVDIMSKLDGYLITLLMTRFPTTPEKHSVFANPKGYTIACPICGDSTKDVNKKRGHIYLATASFKCWNCSAYRPLHIFLDQFNVGELTPSDMNKLSVQHVMKNSTSKRSLAEFYNKDNMLDKNSIMKAHRLTDITKSVGGTSYLIGRNAFIEGRLDDMAWNDKYENLYTFNMFDGCVIGLQLRLSKPMSNGSRFISYNYNDIQAKMLKLEEYDMGLAQSFDRVSLIYNILNVDFTKTVNVFESAINSKYFENSIALWGSGTMLSIKNGNYYFDNDNAGRKASMKMLNEGNMVFLWQLFLKDYKRFVRCSDINDIKKIDPNFDVRVMVKYLGNNVFDKRYL